MGWQIIWTAFPMFLLGHGAYGLLLVDSVRRPVWRPLAFAGYGACILCLIVGSLSLIWS